MEAFEQSNEALLGVGELRRVIQPGGDHLAFDKIQYHLGFVHDSIRQCLGKLLHLKHKLQID